jgi:hypothetical protein
MTEPYVLYGSHASYYTAKTRSYLRKKAIPFIERMPSHPRFRSHVRPATANHRVPQMETPDGLCLQDTTVIFDLLEARFPEIPAIPSTPRQRVITHLMELFASEGLVRMAWQYRWFHEANFQFVKMDFGRSFRPQGSDAELLQYGNVIADQMMSLGKIAPTEADKAELEASYLKLLRCMEDHLIEHPFLLGGHPSAGDYALMGALYAHLGRDPVPLRLMQDHAPRVFRWVEHMNTPEIQSPEFPDVPIAYAPDDTIPTSLEPLLRFLFEGHADRFINSAHAWNAVIEAGTPEAGEQISADRDQPLLPPVTISREGVEVVARAAVLDVWLLQRALGFFHSLGPSDQAAVRDQLARVGGEGLVSVQIQRPPVRRNGRFEWGPQE